MWGITTESPGGSGCGGHPPHPDPRGSTGVWVRGMTTDNIAFFGRWWKVEGVRAKTFWSASFLASSPVWSPPCSTPTREHPGTPTWEGFKATTPTSSSALSDPRMPHVRVSPRDCVSLSASRRTSPPDHTPAPCRSFPAPSPSTGKRFATPSTRLSCASPSTFACTLGPLAVASAGDLTLSSSCEIIPSRNGVCISPRMPRVPPCEAPL